MGKIASISCSANAGKDALATAVVCGVVAFFPLIYNFGSHFVLFTPAINFVLVPILLLGALVLLKQRIMSKVGGILWGSMMCLLLLPALAGILALPFVLIVMAHGHDPFCDVLQQQFIGPHKVQIYARAPEFILGSREFGVQEWKPVLPGIAWVDSLCMERDVKPTIQAIGDNTIQIDFPDKIYPFSGKDYVRVRL